MNNVLIAFALLTLLGTGLCSGCSDDNDGDYSVYADRLAAKLRSCGLLTEGRLGGSFVWPTTKDERCVLSCYLDLPCEALQEKICAGTFPPSMIACYDSCASHECADGSTIIPDYRVCDYEQDCPDGSDEEGCPPSTFYCADGNDPITVPLFLVCDTFLDCSDGSDEAGCTYFDCADGLYSISAENICDYHRDCEDGSDEVDCPGFVCADGSQTVPWTWVCDGGGADNSNCRDGSDELGCADYVCPQ